MAGKVTRSDLSRFFDKVSPEPNSGCWLWIGGYNDSDYGVFWYQQKLMGAHRASYLLFVGPVAEDSYVMHRCDNPPCVNPDHLMIGTPEDNALDMTQKGRRAFGSKHGGSKLDEESAAEIKRLLSAGEVQRVIAEKFGIKQPTVSDIHRKKTWVSV